jgi:hypothetical protein
VKLERDKLSPRARESQLIFIPPAVDEAASSKGENMRMLSNKLFVIYGGLLRQAVKISRLLVDHTQRTTRRR